MSSLINKPHELSFEGNVKENWRRFKRSFERYLDALNSIQAKKEPLTDEAKIALLLNVAGEASEDVFEQFNLTEDEKKNYNKVITAFEDYCCPKSNSTYLRYKFQTRLQEENEPFDKFLLELRKLSTDCNFCATCKELLLCDRVIIGIRDAVLREELIREPALTLEKAITSCSLTETARKQAEEITKKETAVDINAINMNRKSFPRKIEAKFPPKKTENNDNETYECKKCGYKHKARSCPAYDKICNNCGNYGHFVIGCKIKKYNNRDNHYNNLDRDNAKNDKVVNRDRDNQRRIMLHAHYARA